MEATFSACVTGVPRERARGCAFFGITLFFHWNFGASEWQTQKTLFIYTSRLAGS